MFSIMKIGGVIQAGPNADWPLLNIGRNARAGLGVDQPVLSVVQCAGPGADWGQRFIQGFLLFDFYRLSKPDVIDNGVNLLLGSCVPRSFLIQLMVIGCTQAYNTRYNTLQ